MFLGPLPVVNRLAEPVETVHDQLCVAHRVPQFAGVTGSFHEKLSAFSCKPCGFRPVYSFTDSLPRIVDIHRESCKSHGRIPTTSECVTRSCRLDNPLARGFSETQKTSQFPMISYACLREKTVSRSIGILRTVVNWEILGEPWASRARRKGE